MKRRELIRYLEDNGCLFLREGGRHTIYYNPVNKRTSAVPRHNEIVNILALKICTDLEIPRP
ncbi:MULTISPECIES: type II toxin-antitoxin system HicA family toxin [unclassified Nodularia (in: cyanobacteria)]|uniref:type II toxin-antitoxin system HicA family toxin n=1 Tax=unclassified Nodularia (in: cyanobacteria) TaxID=2656917 RepID=UPI00187E9BEF|nr:type II toxin-antitoxin system HicA family toxin [Nodularia sp. LEGE 06071]MBE9197495.1 type II toxin-antitoxin system HicA family toxin [Nodularia sp. LEGE 06071]MCC2696051.1 type II toxin-antitoxin system HicA family toxin [Nodularia sp. LEGE 04288]